MVRWQVAVVGLGVVLLLGILAGALGSGEFRGGKPIPWPEEEDFFGGEATQIPDTTMTWILQILRLVIFLGLLVLLIELIFFKKARRRILKLLLSAFVFLCVWFLFSPKELTIEEPPVEAVTGAVGAEGVPEAEGPPQAPGWAVYIAALAAGLILAFWLLPRLSRRWARGRTARAIQEAAKTAKEELDRGLPVSDVVLRCWLRMVEILSAKAGAKDRPATTPREFAKALATLGFKSEAIEALTRMFEEVRYGHKESEARRELALAALAAIERAYS